MASLAWFCEHGNLVPGWEKREGGNHPDGWGVAWREEGEIRCARGGKPAASDPLLPKLRVRTDRFIGHVRRASNMEAVGAKNAHPFLLSGIALAHNGTFYGKIGEEGERRRVSDTLVFLELLSERWKERTFEGLKKILGEILSDTDLVGDYSSANLLIAAGEGLFALRVFCKNPDYYTLFVSEKEGIRAVSSQPPGYAEWGDNGGWRLLENGELFNLTTGESRFLP
ncbi:MAG: class II glutamine amidotransferase [Syntrophorhabdaceae bacterium]|nr:class II glutamine amidotransferase [Syntrophorhabdaceae bacterium]